MVSVYQSAVARFYAPSDLGGAGGMYRERIRASPQCYGAPRYDTVFVVLDGDTPGMQGMVIARVLLFFSFSFGNKDYSCALVHWFVRREDVPDADTDMWIVEPEFTRNGRRVLEVIEVQTIARGAHLLPVYGTGTLPEDFNYVDALDAFRSYYVNPYIDHHE